MYVAKDFSTLVVEIPLAPLNGIESWSLLNLILAIAGIALVIMVGVKSLKKKKHEKKDGKQHEAPYGDVERKENTYVRLAFILAVPLLALAGIAVFLLTQDIMLPMVITDWWTLTHAILLVCGILSYILAYKRDKGEYGDAGKPTRTVIHTMMKP